MISTLSPPQCHKWLEPTKSLEETKKAVSAHLQNAFNTALNADDLSIPCRKRIMNEIYTINSLLRLIKPKLNAALKRLNELAFSVYCSNEIPEQHRLYHQILIANLECACNLKGTYTKPNTYAQVCSNFLP